MSAVHRGCYVSSCEVECGWDCTKSDELKRWMFEEMSLRRRVYRVTGETGFPRFRSDRLMVRIESEEED